MNIVTNIKKIIISTFSVGIIVAAVLITAFSSSGDNNGLLKYYIPDHTEIYKGLTNNDLWYAKDAPHADKYNYGAYIQTKQQRVRDGSFNESMLNGTINFAQDEGIAKDKGTPAYKKVTDSNNKPFFPDNVEGPNKNGASVYIAADDKLNSFVGQYEQVSNAGFKIGICGGFQHINPIETLLSEPKYKNMGFLLEDTTLENPHVASVLFKADQSGFLAGIASCFYLKEYYSDYSSGGLKAATYGGKPFDPVIAYMAGFQQGIWYYNDNYAKEDKYKVSFVDLGTKEQFFTNSFETDAGRAMAVDLLVDGADVIMPVAGAQTEIVVDQIIKNKTPTMVVGVDTPMENDSQFQKKNAATGRPTIAFSATKNLDLATTLVLQNLDNGVSHNTKNNTGGFGYTTIGDFDNGLTGLSANGIKILEDYIGTNWRKDLKTPINDIKPQLQC